MESTLNELYECLTSRSYDVSIKGDCLVVTKGNSSSVDGVFMSTDYLPREYYDKVRIVSWIHTDETDFKLILQVRG